MSIPLKAVAVAGIATALVAGSSAVAQAATHHRGSIALHVTSKHQVSAPNTTRPGLVRLRNTGGSDIVLVKNGSGDVSTLVKDLSSESKSAEARFEKKFTIVDILSGHSDVYLKLSRGSYFLLDVDREKFKAADVHTLRVTGARLNAVKPVSKRVGIDGHNRLTAPKSVAKYSYLHVMNNSAHLQLIEGFGVGNDVSTATLNAFLAHPTLDALANLDVTTFVEIAEIPAHSSLYTGVRSKRGRYVYFSVAVKKKADFNFLTPSHIRLVAVT